MFDQNVADTIARVAAANGINPAFALAVASRESRMNPASPGTGSIFGLYQMSGPLRTQYGIGDSTDPAKETAGWSRFIGDTRGQMAHLLGRQPTDGELYLAHYWGPKRAARVIDGTYAGMAPSDVFSAKELKLNPNLARYKTVGDAAQSIEGDISSRMQRWGAAPATADPTEAAQPAEKPPVSTAATAAPVAPSRPDFAAFGSQEAASAPKSAAPAANDLTDSNVLASINKAGAGDLLGGLSGAMKNIGSGGDAGGGPPIPQIETPSPMMAMLPQAYFPVHGLPAMPGAQPQQQRAQQQPAAAAQPGSTLGLYV